MFNYIEKLRQKPESQKKRFAFLAALCVCGLIILVWFSVVIPKFRQEKQTDDKIANTESTPTSALTRTFSDGFSAIVTQFKNIKNIISSFKSSGESFVAPTSTMSQDPIANPDPTL